MGSTVLVAVVTILAVVEAARIKRESDCEKITLSHGECIKQAYETYVADHGAGDDGRGDWEARKSCNYVNSAVGECGDVLADCFGEDEAVAMKDHQVGAILKQLERSVGGWDSSKCPVVSEYLERQAGVDGEEVADGDQGDEEGAEEDGSEEEDAADGEEGAEEVNDEDEEADGEESDAEEGDAAEGDAAEGDAEEGDDEEGDDEEGDGEEGDDEEGDGEEGDDEEGDESEDGGEGDEDIEEEDEEEEDAGEEDDESSSPILLSSFTMVVACLLAA